MWGKKRRNCRKCISSILKIELFCQFRVFPPPLSDYLYTYRLVQLFLLRPHLGVCFMYPWEWRHGPSGARALVCFMLCSCFKQFRVSVTHIGSRGDTATSRDVSSPAIASAVCVCSVAHCLSVKEESTHQFSDSSIQQHI